MRSLVIAAVAALAFASAAHAFMPDPNEHKRASNRTAAALTVSCGHRSRTKGHCRMHQPTPALGDGSVRFRGASAHGRSNEGWERDRGSK
jgi:hypothetical protein